MSALPPEGPRANVSWETDTAGAPSGIWAEFAGLVVAMAVRLAVLFAAAAVIILLIFIAQRT